MKWITGRTASVRMALVTCAALAIASATSGAAAGRVRVASAAEKQSATGGAVIRSEADLVVLPVSVIDSHGHFVPGLKEADFHVYDDGKPQQITLFMDTDSPATAGLLIDCSSSMKENREKVVEAAKDFLGSSNPQDEMFVVNFNQTPEFGLPPEVGFTSDVSQLQAAVQSGPSEGMTALYDAIGLGLRQLARGDNQKKALIIISDGGDDASLQKLKKTLAGIQQSSTIIYTIGIVASDQADVNPGVLRKLAEQTGGQAYFPKRAEQLPGICQQIARDLRAQYTIAFLPPGNGRNGVYRKIRVAVKAPGRHGLKVRTRAGYLAQAKASANAWPGL